MEDFPISTTKMADLLTLIDTKKVSSTVASQKVFPEMLKTPEMDPLKIAENLNVIQDSNEDSIIEYINQVITNNPNEVERYRNGEKQLTGFLMGQLMKISKGKADPKAANQLLRNALDK